MQAFKKAALAGIALFCAAAVHAATLTYDFTGVMDNGSGFDGQTITGSLTVDTGAYDVLKGNHETWAQGGMKDDAGAALFQATISLSGGFSMTLGGPGNPLASGATLIEKSDDGPNYFGVDVHSAPNSNAYRSISIRTGNYEQDPSLTFPRNSPTDLSLDQKARFHPGSFNDGGAFAIELPNLESQRASFSLTSVTGSGVAAVVPEPGSLAMLFAGLGACGAIASRRRGKA